METLFIYHQCLIKSLGGDTPTEIRLFVAFHISTCLPDALGFWGEAELGS